MESGGIDMGVAGRVFSSDCSRLGRASVLVTCYSFIFKEKYDGGGVICGALLCI